MTEAEWWVSPWTPDVDDEQAALGRRRVRLLHQMRRPLPLERELVEATRPIEVRPFTEADTDAFLRVNNRAFEWHPDQSNWDRSRLAVPMSEPWYDPEGFLVLPSEDRPGELDGFCWTKVHHELGEDDPEGPRPTTGEIFVIGADPDAHGKGFGRALTVAGLEYLTDLGLTLAMLYVEADNEPAIALYRRLGFEVHHSNAGYASTAAPSSLP